MRHVHSGLLVGSVMAMVGVLLAPCTARAQGDEASIGRRGEEGRETLADRIPAVSNRFFTKKGRIELSPQIGLSLNDPFYRNIIAGGALSFHILEQLSVGASGEVYIGVENDVDVSGGGQPAKPDYNRAVYAARLDLAYAPIYGKLSLMAEHVLHFDTYISVGAGVVGPDDTSPTFAGTVALGQHYLVNEWLALKFEVRDQIFSLKRLEDGESDLQHLLTATVGLCFYLPMKVDRPSLQ